MQPVFPIIREPGSPRRDDFRRKTGGYGRRSYQSVSQPDHLVRFHLQIPCGESHLAVANSPMVIGEANVMSTIYISPSPVGATEVADCISAPAVAIWRPAQ